MTTREKQAVREAKLTEQDRKDLVEFLKALSGKGWPPSPT